jgi:hypothetical protein
MSKLLTGCLNTDAVNQLKCSHCGAEPEHFCVAPSGKNLLTPHTERTSALVAKEQSLVDDLSAKLQRMSA